MSYTSIMAIVGYSHPIATTIVASRNTAFSTVMTSIENTKFFQTQITVNDFFGRPPGSLRNFQQLYPLFKSRDTKLTIFKFVIFFINRDWHIKMNYFCSVFATFILHLQLERQKSIILFD